MTKLSHLLWYWQAEWGLSACTCGLLALVWKQGLWEKIYSILLFKLDLFLCQFMTLHTFFVSFPPSRKSMLTCIIDMNLFFKLSQEKQWWRASTQVCCLDMCLLQSEGEERQNQPKQIENKAWLFVRYTYEDFPTAEPHLWASRCS